MSAAAAHARVICVGHAALDHVIFSERGIEAYSGGDSEGGLRRVLANRR
ncbi:MAG: hypothetical protein HY067_04820 [Betaproteobacteria bacterium]|nr:hypothetical protein [Betaproteobacteria bacterium]